MLNPQAAPALLSSARKPVVLEKVKGTENPHHRQHGAAARCKAPVHTEAPGGQLTYRPASALNPAGAEPQKAFYPNCTGDSELSGYLLLGT